MDKINYSKRIAEQGITLPKINLQCILKMVLNYFSLLQITSIRTYSIIPPPFPSLPLLVLIS